MHKLKQTLILLTLGFLTACSSTNSPFERINDFDQAPFLNNLGNQLILPAYLNLQQESNQLLVTVQELIANPNLETLTACRTQLKATRLVWQSCAPYSFGPAAQFGLTAALNIYPIDVYQVEQNIASGSYDLQAIAQADARGFQTLGYLLHGDTDENVLAKLNEQRSAYLLAIATDIQTTVAAVYEAWSEDGGNYISTFQQAFGTDAGSSVGQMVNGMIRHFERNTRDGKVGIPVGIRTGGDPIPTYTEAYYGDYSVELLHEALVQYELIFMGDEGIGFDDYLRGIGATTLGNTDLTERIILQYAQIQSAIGAIADPMPEALINQQQEVERIFVEMQALATLYKTDMASSMGIIISFQDTDGD